MCRRRGRRRGREDLEGQEEEEAQLANDDLMPQLRLEWILAEIDKVDEQLRWHEQQQPVLRKEYLDKKEEYLDNQAALAVAQERKRDLERWIHRLLENDVERL